MNYVYSTLTDSMFYTFYVSNKDQFNDLPVITKKIHIKGGANVATKQLVTPLGVVTEVSDEDLALLQHHPIFQLHEKNGFIKVDGKKYDVEKAVATMEKRDEASPLTPQDYEFAPDNTAKPEGLSGKKQKR